MSDGYVFDYVTVHAYLRESDLVLVSASLCSTFVLYYEPDWEVLPQEAPPDELGHATQRAFARCRVQVEDPPTLVDTFVKRLGAKSRADMVRRLDRASMSKSMRSTCIDIRNTIPKGRNGAFGSFHRVVDLHDTQALGQALWEALRTTD